MTKGGNNFEPLVHIFLQPNKKLSETLKVTDTKKVVIIMTLRSETLKGTDTLPFLRDNVVPIFSCQFFIFFYICKIYYTSVVIIKYIGH